jgi:hypothetical protein
MKNVLLILTTLIILMQPVSGQKAPIKFGEVSLDELQMISYPGDTSASAVILCDYGFFNSTNLNFTRILRIKILKKEGYVWANSSYPIRTKSSIRGITSNLENGKIVQEKLKNESMFTDRVTENYLIRRVAMPDVKVGSVIDLQFNFIGIPGEWKFQETIPVKYSELILENTPNIRFKFNYFGYEPLAITSPTRWVGKNMPSFKVEPFITSKENYLTKFEFDILDVSATGFYMAVSTSWEVISGALMKDENFGLALTGSLYLNSLAKTIEDSRKTGEEKLKLAYESLKSAVKWDEKEAPFVSNTSLGFTYKMKLGNSADINLLLYQLLKKLDFPVSLVVMSTRSNGFLPISPSMEKINYVIVQTQVGDKSFLLDATEPYMPFYLVPFRCLNNKGRFVNETRSDLVDLVTLKKEKEYTTYSLKIQDDKSLKGNLSICSIDYSALKFRQNYHEFNSIDEYLEDFKKDKQGLIINESKIDNIDSLYLPVNENYDVTLNNQANVIGNEVYILPMLYNQLKENPFKMDTRLYPVDYGYNIEKTITASYEIPDNYEVSALPASSSFKMAGNGASFLYEVSRTGNIIKVSSIFSINKTMFLQNEYNGLKEFYNQVIKKQSEPIILKKK